MEHLSSLIGVDLDELHLAISLIIVFPLAFIHRRLHDVTTKHCFSLLSGLFLAFFMFGWDSLHFFVSSTVVLLIVRTLNWRISPYIAFFYCLVHLSYGHLCRMQHSYLIYTIDWSLPQMMLTCKLTSFAWDYHDGQIPEEKTDRAAKKRGRIDQLPSLLEYYGWVFFFVGFLSGPFPYFNDYSVFTNRSMFKETNGEIPTSYRSTLGKILLVLVSFVGVKLNGTYNEMYTTQPEFMEFSFINRMLYIWLSVELGFCKYYFVWSMGEAAANVIGISYNGLDEHGRARWDRTVMMRLWEFKKASNGKAVISNWNIQCQVWLKHYVFLRLIEPIGVSLAKLSTFIISGIWHGFYPGYHLFFISAGILEPLGTLLRKNFRWRVINPDGTPKPTKVIYDFVGWFITFWTLDYLTLAFRLLAFQYAIAGWASVYFNTHIIAVLLFLYFTFFGIQEEQDTSKKKS
eukprot:TRINITY_DN3766_c0_g1_i1.p1 TRINITY_DN3766_c0_g1~~TRINITY_DN3766_c0_g1_i1.p1  ORF type:complete len:458 (+),score=43.09 TRINITY_DN3766_c0_g1_i1:212-1585(+)